MLLVYPRGVRIIVHTANLIFVDWNNKSQGLWMQDFPWKDQSNPSKGCGFENDLIDYLSALKVSSYNHDFIHFPISIVSRCLVHNVNENLGLQCMWPCAQRAQIV